MEDIYVTCVKTWYCSRREVVLVNDIFKGKIVKFMSEQGPYAIVKTDEGRFIDVRLREMFEESKWDISKILDEFFKDTSPLHIESRIAKQFGLPEYYRTKK